MAPLSALDADDREHADLLAELVARLPPGVDRAAVLQTIHDGVAKRRVYYELLDPNWCRDRDQALRAIGRAIEGFRSVLKRSPFDIVEPWAGGLEREYRRITQPWDGARHYMIMSRESEGLHAGAGRPRATWRAETKAKLLGLGVSGAAAEELLETAGLTEKTPTPGGTPGPKTRHK